MKYGEMLVVAIFAVAACDSAGPRGPNDPGDGDDDGQASVDGGVPDLPADAGTHETPNEDGGVVTPPPDGGTETPDGGSDGCASPPVATYSGEQFEQYSGSGSYERTRVEVTWTLASTEGCVDRYTPSGTVFSEDAGPCEITLEPAFGAIEAGDGELVIDRTTSPATYTMRGSSTFDTIYTGDPSCDDTPEPTPGTAGGAWADSSGSFDGAVIAGVAWTNTPTRSWNLVAAGASFPTPDGCSVAATDQWTSEHQYGGFSATVTWTRVATEGCVDTYQPSGTAARDEGYDEMCTYDALSTTIDPEDGPMTIDRSTAPPTVKLRGVSSWDTVGHCVNNWGEPYEQDVTFYSMWGEALDVYGIPFDGNRWSGTYTLAFGRGIAWSFARP
jgi:hypothetical protein